MTDQPTGPTPMQEFVLGISEIHNEAFNAGWMAAFTVMGTIETAMQDGATITPTVHKALTQGAYHSGLSESLDNMNDMLREMFNGGDNSDGSAEAGDSGAPEAEASND